STVNGPVLGLAARSTPAPSGPIRGRRSTTASPRAATSRAASAGCAALSPSPSSPKPRPSATPFRRSRSDRDFDGRCSGANRHRAGAQLPLESSSDRYLWFYVRRSPPGYREASAGELADRRGTGLLALRGPADHLAALVDRPAAAARFQPGDGRVPG